MWIVTQSGKLVNADLFEMIDVREKNGRHVIMGHKGGKECDDLRIGEYETEDEAEAAFDVVVRQFPAGTLINVPAIAETEARQAEEAAERAAKRDAAISLAEELSGRKSKSSD